MKNYPNKNKLKNNNKIIIVLTLIILFFVSINILEKSKIPDPELEEEAYKILNAISSNSLKLLNYNQLDEKSFEEIKRIDYISLKNGLGLKSDFCVHFEDINGNLLRLNGVDAVIGSSKVKINGISCG